MDEGKYFIQLGVIYMRLIKCPECGNKIPKKVNYCPGCGVPLGVSKLESQIDCIPQYIDNSNVNFGNINVNLDILWNQTKDKSLMISEILKNTDGKKEDIEQIVDKYIFDMSLKTKIQEEERLIKFKPLSYDFVVRVLGLSGELKKELSLVYKYANDSNLQIYYWVDLKALCKHIYEESSIWDLYYFNTKCLRELLRKIAIAEAEGKALLEVEDFIDNNIKYYDNIHSGVDFERFCMELLKVNGYKNIENTSASGDHGVDILCEKDYITYAIQCKYYSSPVGNSAIQEVFSGKKIYSKDIAVVMTNSTFTRQAINDAKELGVKLWDGEVLNMMKKQLIKVI